ncbi:MAG: T9SS type A sorting domain-containing protein [Candidatus Cloacimonetes bacterium]|nr:T9SS type A sorting domain-containing protein [Candidatus Cloacimonadota bacterium]
MKKLTLFLIVAFALAGFLYAQDPPENLNVECIDDYAHFIWDPPSSGVFYEDFEGTFPPDGWLKLNPDGGTGWEPLQVGTTPIPGWTGGEATACPDGGSWQAFCTWTTGGATMNDQWLITPQITVEDSDELAFYMMYFFDNYDDYIEILISTTVQNDPVAFDIVVDAISFTTGSSEEWELYSYNLTDFVTAGTDVYIAFRETVADNLADGSAISIDNVYVGSPADIISTTTVLKAHSNTQVERIINYVHVPNTHIVNSRDLLGYNVYLDGDSLDFTTDTEWQFFDLVNGQFYDAGVSAVYDDPPGESEIIEINFEYTGTGAGDIIVAKTELINNYPNPFNPVTNIAFSLGEPGHITLEVYNIKGEKVRTLINEVLPANNHVVTWNGVDDNNKSVSSGVYFYKMRAGGRYTSTKKMILMK